MATTLPSPSAGVISDGQHSLRKAVARALPGVPHQLCQFHYLYLRAAARPIFEADRHATKERKKRVRGVRPMERELEGRADGRCGGGRARPLPGGDPQCAHRRRPPARPRPRGSSCKGAWRRWRLRSSTWSGRPSAAGPILPGKGLMKLLVRLLRLLRLVRSGLEAMAPLWPPLLSCSAYAFVHRAAHLLANHEQAGTA